MKKLIKLEVEKYLREPIDIFKIKSKQEFLGLINKFPLRVLFNPKNFNTFAWNANLLDHSYTKNILKNYIQDIDSYESFKIEDNYLIPSILKYGISSVEKFFYQYFPQKKIEKNKYGYSIKPL